MVYNDFLLIVILILDFGVVFIVEFIVVRGWCDLFDIDKIGVIYDYICNEIVFGYNCVDDILVFEVLFDGYG